MKYLPFLNGVYSTSPGLTPTAKGIHEEDQFVFHLDENFHHYRANKEACRNENIDKYYLEHELNHKTVSHINQAILRQLLDEYPQYFTLEREQRNFSLLVIKTGERINWSDDWVAIESSGYRSLFDALCCQLQEDLAIFQLNKEHTKDHLAAIHLCAPNHWSPAEKIGRSFDQVHAPVPGMEKMNLHYSKMLSAIVSTKGPYTRFAWGISTDTRLNHHPEAPEGVEHADWHGRTIDHADQKFYVRTERQTLIGFQEADAFLFTIRTYFYDIDLLEIQEKRALASALNSMSPEALVYKGLTKTADVIRKRLIPD